MASYQHPKSASTACGLCHRHNRTAASRRRRLVFLNNKASLIFAKVFTETKQRYVFEFCGLRLENETLEFYIKPGDGLELPVIMKWLKQVFSKRYNHEDGRTGHIWGDRCWPLILEGEPPDGGEAAGEAGVRPQHQYTSIRAVFFLFPAGIEPG